MPVQERRLAWYEHVMRREEEYFGRRGMRMDGQRRRRKGRPKRWSTNSTRVNGLSGEEMQYYLEVGIDADEACYINIALSRRTQRSKLFSID